MGSRSSTAEQQRNRSAPFGLREAVLQVAQRVFTPATGTHSQTAKSPSPESRPSTPKPGDYNRGMSGACTCCRRLVAILRVHRRVAGSRWPAVQRSESGGGPRVPPDTLDPWSSVLGRSFVTSLVADNPDEPGSGLWWIIRLTVSAGRRFEPHPPAAEITATAHPSMTRV